MSSKKYSTNKRVVRHLRIRKKLAGTSLAPRLAVFRSNKKIYAQVIDDDKNITLTKKGASKKFIVKFGNTTKRGQFDKKIF